MDDSIKKNLISQTEQVSEIKNSLIDIDSSVDDSDIKLQQLKEKSNKMREKFKIKGIIVPEVKISEDDIDNSEETISQISKVYTYEEITKSNILFLNGKNNNISFDDLFSQEELKKIEHDLSTVIEKEKWDKWDYIVTICAGVFGGLFDLFLNHKLLENEKMHAGIAHSKLSTDAHIEGYARDEHRIFGPGHDLFRWNDAVEQMKSGEYNVNVGGESVNVKGYIYNGELKPFRTKIFEKYSPDLIHFRHMLADFFSKRSLPIPGLSFLLDDSSKEGIDFMLYLYKGGFHLRGLLSNFSGVLLTEFILRFYIHLRRWKNGKEFNLFLANNEKHCEMFMVGHGINVAMNIGKIIVTENIGAINLPAIFALTRYTMQYLIMRWKRRDEALQILIRNAKEIDAGWDKLLIETKESILHDQDFKNIFLKESLVI